jgi:hypothetical protein
MPPLLTQFASSPSKLAILAPCMDPDGDDDEEAEWRNNFLSARTVVYESGVIARRGESVHHAVDPEELSLCGKLAGEAVAIMKGASVGMGSESSSSFSEFFVAANADVPRRARIDEEVVRRAFGGTIFPPTTITVEPLEEAGTWWSEVLADGEGQPDAYFAPWRALIAWFARQEAFVESAFVRVGDYGALLALDRSSYPEGTDSPGCVFPRIAIGLTHGGSLAGVFGHVVQT